MSRSFLLQAEMEPDLAKRFVILRDRFGMTNKTLLTRILAEALPRWELIPDLMPVKEIK